MTQAPIPHWSFSSLKLFLNDPFAFREQYILGKWDDLKGPSLVVGSAVHKALEMFYKGEPIPVAIGEGQKYIASVPDAQIDYGKTGSRENIIKDYTQALNFYFEERPKIGEVLGVEQSIVTPIDFEGVEQPIPIKAKIDLITRDLQGRLVIRDHKTCTSFTDTAEESPERILQAVFYRLAVARQYGEEPYAMVFDEIKISRNKNGEPQRQEYVILLNEHPEYLTFFSALYEACTREVLREDHPYLPNLSSMFTGKRSFDGYRARLLSSDVQSLPKVRSQPLYVGAQQRAEKQYVASFTDGVDFDKLSDEEKIKAKLLEFGLPVEMDKTFRGPRITKFTFKPSRGVRMAQFEKHAKDLAIALQAASIRVEAPIMGTALVGVEIPAQERKYSLLDASHYSDRSLLVPIGVDVFGNVVKKDLSAMPHLLVAGTTGSGKSVFLNVLIKALSAQNGPEDLHLVLIDPKRVEFAGFKGLPHLAMPPITEIERATRIFLALVEEMEERYTLLETAACRNIDEYNEKHAEKMPKTVVVVDEIADLMLQAEDGQFEKAAIRLAQKARAAGIHLVLGTQRPSVDIVTGVLKANMPTRIAFRTASEVDSRVILDTEGAEELLGKGDLLFLDPGTRGLQRLQSLYV